MEGIKMTQKEKILNLLVEYESDQNAYIDLLEFPIQ